MSLLWFILAFLMCVIWFITIRQLWRDAKEQKARKDCIDKNNPFGHLRAIPPGALHTNTSKPNPFLHIKGKGDNLMKDEMIKDVKFSEFVELGNPTKVIIRYFEKDKLVKEETLDLR